MPTFVHVLFVQVIQLPPQSLKWPVPGVWHCPAQSMVAFPPHVPAQSLTAVPPHTPRQSGTAVPLHIPAQSYSARPLQIPAQSLTAVPPQTPKQSFVWPGRQLVQRGLSMLAVTLTLPHPTFCIVHVKLPVNVVVNTLL